MRQLEPRKKLVQNISKLFSFGVQMSGNRKIISMGCDFTRTYIYVKPQEKITHDRLRGYGSVHDFTHLETRILTLEINIYNDYKFYNAEFA